MKKIKDFIRRRKLACIACLFGLILIISGMSSLARYRNRSGLELNTTWDGSVASSFGGGSGTKSNPYIIRNAGEFAYFIGSLVDNDYAGKYIKLANNIIINNGKFYMDGDVSKYNKDDAYYFVCDGELSNSGACDSSASENINIFEKTHSFRGDFDGYSYTVYGLYLHGEESALFDKLYGSVHDVYFSNVYSDGSANNIIAGFSSGALIKNVMVDGVLVSESANSAETKEIDIEDYAVTIDEVSTSYEKIFDISSIKNNRGKISNILLTFDFTSSSHSAIRINGNTIDSEVGSVSESLSDLSSFKIEFINYNEENETSYDTSIDYTLSNIKVSYDVVDNSSSAFVGTAYDTSIINSISKVDNHASTGAGFISYAYGSTSIKQSYNTGSATSGFVYSSLYGNGNILRTVYNSGSVNSAFINEAIYSDISINSAINTGSCAYLVASNEGSSVSGSNVYSDVGSGVSHSSYSSNFSSKNSFKSHGFNEFVSIDNLGLDTTSVWIYNGDSDLPILMIDDLANPLFELHVSTFTSSDVLFEVEEHYFGNSVAFSIAAINEEIRPIASSYYYVSEGKRPLSMSEINAISEWNTYSNVVSLSDEGSYIIYAKCIDSEGHVFYVSSDVYNIDLTAPMINITYLTNVYSDMNESVKTINIVDNVDLHSVSEDAMSNVSSLEYMISRDFMSSEDLDSYEEWTTYEDKITIDTLGNNIVYVKAVDSVGNTGYANSAVFAFGGYEVSSFKAGRNSISSSSTSINGKSSITLNYVYNDASASYSGSETHKIVSNKYLPMGTKVMLEVGNNKYYVKLNDVSNDIAFTSFKKIGMKTNSFFEEPTTGTLYENFKVTVDFSESDISSGTDLSGLLVYPEIYKDGELFHSTLVSNYKYINVLENKNYHVNVGSSYSSSIRFDSTSVSNVPISASVSYDDGVVDTSIQDMNLGLLLWVADSSGNVMPKNKLSSLTFRIGENVYSPSDDGYIRINLNNGLNSFSDNLVIGTNIEGSYLLSSGSYSIKIKSDLSYDGSNADVVSGSTVSITLNNNYSEVKHSFDVIESNDRIVNKSGYLTFNYVINQGGLSNPSVRVSLLEKKNKSSNTGVNQEYTLKDLNTYLVEGLTKVSEDGLAYYALSNPSASNEFSMQFNTAKFGYTGYKVLFELYDGETKISSYESKFIVR